LCKPAWSPSLFLNPKPPKIHFYFSCRPISQEYSSEDSKSSHLWLRKHLRDPLWHQRNKKESEVAQFQSLGLATEKLRDAWSKASAQLFAENTSDSFLLLPSSRKERSEKRKKASRTLTVVEFFRKKNREKKSTTTQEKPRSTTKQEKKLQLKDNPGIYFFCTLFFCKKISPSLSKPRTIV
jgi:hypothetical protein